MLALGRGGAHAARSPASRSTDSGSRTWPTRSTSATTSFASSRRQTPSSTRRASPAHLSFVFVGAGYAGVEALAELSDLAADALRYYPRLRGIRQRWILVDAAPKILPEIPPRLGDYAARELAGRGVEIHVSTTLESLAADEALLSNGERIPTHTLVWTAGVRPNPLLGELGLPLDDRGRVRVDPFLRVEGRERLWALGDGAAVPNEATPGRVDPPTCQHALRQARRLAKNLSGELEPYRYRMLGQVATLGRYKGIADVLGLRAAWLSGLVDHAQLPPAPAAAPAAGSFASSPTGRRRSSSAATSPSSLASAIRTGSASSAAGLAPRSAQRLQCRGERLVRRQHALEQVAFLRRPARARPPS